MKQLHVAQAKYASNAQSMLLMLSTLDRKPKFIEEFFEHDPVAYVYEDVPPEVWEEFKRTGYGPEADVFWETRFKGHYNEEECSPILMLLHSLNN